MDDPSPLTATLELRFQRAWSLCYEDKREEAETAAAELLLEPRLGPFHQAGMHLLLAMSPSDYVEHALEAVRIYKSIADRQNMTEFETETIGKLLNDANQVLAKARQDQTGFDRKIQKILAGGMTMEELHDLQIKEMNQRLDAEETGESIAEEVIKEAGDSQMTGTDSQMTDSQRTDSQTTDQRAESQTTVTYSRAASVADSKHTVTGDLDDDEPLPDIVRYKFDDNKGI